ncbi:MAG: uridine kinase, partial [Deltaproteobacteria bacterium]|nr:uridine kinase [Deltaproteobacteria bacterium]
IGIAGASGSGKTFLAGRVMEHLGPDKAAIIQEDSYYEDLSDMPFDERAATNFDHPDAFDHDLLAEQLLQLLSGETILQPVYDYESHRRLKETKTVEPCALIILEGILILSDARLRDLMDLRVFIDTASDVCLMRRLERDIAERGRTADSVIRQYQETVRPMYLRFVEPSKQYADILISGAEEDSAAVDVLASTIDALLHKDCQ